MNLLSYLLIPIAHAQLQLPPVNTKVASGATLTSFMCTVVFSWLFTAAIFLAIILLVVAAYRYMTSAGDPGKVKLANQTLIYLAIGIAVAILARTVPVVVGSLVAGNIQLDPCSQATSPTPGT